MSVWSIPILKKKEKEKKSVFIFPVINEHCATPFEFHTPSVEDSKTSNAVGVWISSSHMALINKIFTPSVINPI